MSEFSYQNKYIHTISFPWTDMKGEAGKESWINGWITVWASATAADKSHAPLLLFSSSTHRDGSIPMTTEMKEDEGELLQRALELTNSLISTTFFPVSFPLKWKLIRRKLEQLSSGLTPTSTDIPQDNSALSRLLQEITATADEIQLLSNSCSDEAYNGGKLQLRSDLDIAAAKLDLHIKRLSEINGSAMLTHSRAIILSPPGAAATREEMRFYVKDLLSRLKIGCSEVRARALGALNDILRDDDRYARILVSETTDGVGLLLGLLESEEMGIQEEASESVSVIASFNSYRGALVTAGAVSVLVRVLEAGSQAGKERAARALLRLTENSDNAWSVSAHGGVTELLKICGDADSGDELITVACGVLRNLSGVGEIKRFMVEEGLVSVLLKFLKSKDEVSRIQSIEFFNSLVSDEDDSIKKKVVGEGMIESLVHVLDPIHLSSLKEKEVALKSIELLCFSSANSMTSILLSAGFLSRVLFLLKSSESSVQQLGLKASCSFCGVSEEAKKAMGDAGFMPEMVKLLEAKSFKVREMAAEALCRMVSAQRNRRRFIQEEHCINRVLQLLDPDEEKSVTKKSLLSLLICLTDSSSGRRKVAASGYVKNLEKLAETDATEAKKIIKKISSNRFRSILNGIWSF